MQSLSSRDQYIHHLYSKALNSPSRKLKLTLMDTLSKMMIIDEIFARFLNTTTSSIHFCRNSVDDNLNLNSCEHDYIPKDYSCLRSLVETFENNCGKFTDYSRKFIRYLVRECEKPTMTHE